MWAPHHLAAIELNLGVGAACPAVDLAAGLVWNTRGTDQVTSCYLAAAEKCAMHARTVSQTCAVGTAICAAGWHGRRERMHAH